MISNYSKSHFAILKGKGLKYKKFKMYDMFKKYAKLQLSKQDMLCLGKYKIPLQLAFLTIIITFGLPFPERTKLNEYSEWYFISSCLCCLYKQSVKHTYTIETPNEDVNAHTEKMLEKNFMQVIYDIFKKYTIYKLWNK